MITSQNAYAPRNRLPLCIVPPSRSADARLFSFPSQPKTFFEGELEREPFFEKRFPLELSLEKRFRLGREAKESGVG